MLIKKTIVSWLGWVVSKPVGMAINLYAYIRNEVVLITIRESLGDTIGATAIAYGLGKKHKVRVITNRPSIFYNLYNVRVTPFAHSNSKFIKVIGNAILMKINEPRVYSYRIKNYGGLSGVEAIKEFDRKETQHLIYAHLQGANNSFVSLLDGITLYPRILIDDDTSKRVLYKYGLKYQKYIVVFSQGKNKMTENKGWPISYIQSFVDSIPEGYTVVQLGGNDDKELDDVLCLKGKTTVDEALSIIKCAALVAGPEGFPNHAAAAVDTKSYLFDTGYTRRSYYQYKTITHFYSGEEVTLDCHPCWLSSKCTNNYKCIPKVNKIELKRSIKNIL